MPSSGATQHGDATGIGGVGASPTDPICPGIVVIVMGVSGSGKSTLGRALARALHAPFLDADDLHPAANVARMARGEPLQDADRWPWLRAVRCAAAAEGAGVVVACSALKKAYRDVLRGDGDGGGGGGEASARFVFLTGARDVLEARIQGRTGHFMKAGMLDGQLAALESPLGERGVVDVPVEWTTEDQVRRVVRALGETR